MLLEVPVVASQVKGMSEYFLNNEELLYYKPGVLNSLVVSVNAILSNIELRKKLIERAKSKITNMYSVSNYADELEKILESL